MHIFSRHDKHPIRKLSCRYQNTGCPPTDAKTQNKDNRFYFVCGMLVFAGCRIYYVALKKLRKTTLEETPGTEKSGMAL